jgi:hypothetical protein
VIDMAGVRATFFFATALSGALLVPLLACGPSEPARAPAPSTSRVAPASFSNADLARYHSARIGVSFPLPDRAQWTITDRDDLNGGWLVAQHAPTSTQLRARRWDAGIAVTRIDCESHAREIGELPKPAEIERRFETLSDEIVTAPKGWDGREWTATETTAGGHVIGHVYLFTAKRRSCVIVHATTEASDAAYAELADRLEILSSRVVGGIMAEPDASPLSLPPPRLP